MMPRLALALNCLAAWASALTVLRPIPLPAGPHPSDCFQRTRKLVAQDGWTTALDEGTGATYYYNELTGQSQWEPPDQTQVPQAAAQSGWTTAVDTSTGQTYYYNEVTGQAQWEPPSQASHWWILGVLCR